MATIQRLDGPERRSDILTELTRLDLNLIVALDALLTERNVTHAAKRLRLSQPALSAALGRLRTHFGDPLLVRRGRGYDLTPLGARLQTLAAGATGRLHTVFSTTTEFDAAQETREFVIHASDYSAITIGARVRRLAAQQAPGVRLRFLHFSDSLMSSVRPLLDNVDGAILPHGFLFDVPHVDVIEDHWVCIVATDNPSVGDALTLENLADLPWVANYHGGGAQIPASSQLALLGIQPRVDTVVEGFLPLAHFVAGTARIAFVQERLARTMPPELGVRWLRPPFDVLPHIGALWWHPVHELDPAHRWLRSLFETAAAEERESADQA
jgi:LysR family transcriptional regulator, nod-box dependent transcriptional activator